MTRIYFSQSNKNNPQRYFQSEAKTIYKKLWSRMPKSLCTSIIKSFHVNENQSNNPYYTQAMLTLCQLLIFKTSKKTQEYSLSSNPSETREAPVAMHIKYMIHSKTKKLGIKLCHLRLSISSNWLLNITINLENTAIKQFEKDEVVCSLRFRHITLESYR